MIYKSICFRTIHNFRIQLLLYEQLFDHQIKGTAMETIFAIVRSNLTVTYFLKKYLLFYHKFFQKTLLNFFFVVTSFNF